MCVYVCIRHMGYIGPSGYIGGMEKNRRYLILNGLGLEGLNKQNYGNTNVQGNGKLYEDCLDAELHGDCHDCPVGASSVRNEVRALSTAIKLSNIIA